MGKRSAGSGRVTLATLLASLLLPACYSPPSSSERFAEPIVVSAPGEDADFGAIQSFFVRPEIRALSSDADGTTQTELLSADLAEPVLSATEENLLARGYTRAGTSLGADVAVELVYLRASLASIDCYSYWYDWTYWGYPSYYPYYAPYSCSTIQWESGMLVTSVVDMSVAPPPVSQTQTPTVPEATPDDVLRGLWFSAVYGIELDSAQFVVERAVEGIDQAFAQSPYFTRAP